MAVESMILERLERLEAEVAPLAASARAVVELRAELAPRVNEAVQKLIAELADVESDFQLEDLLYLVKKLLRNIRNLNFVLDQTKNLIDFALTAEPLLKTTVPQLIGRLDELERLGVLRLLATGVEVLKRVAAAFTAEDLTRAVDGMVRLAEILKKATAPPALELLERAAELPARLDLAAARPVGLFGLLGALGDPRIREGLGVLLELTRGLASLKPASA